jgi:hypothetical protein
MVPVGRVGSDPSPPSTAVIATHGSGIQNTLSVTSVLINVTQTQIFTHKFANLMQNFIHVADKN